MNKAVIVGASSGMGRELARVLAGRGYTLGLAARRLELLMDLRDELNTQTFVKMIDVSRPIEAMGLMRELMDDMGGTDTVIISAGVSFHNPDLDWNKEFDTVSVNVIGFAAMANAAFNYFCGRGTGHIVGISSFRAIRGGWSSPAYNASKAFVSNYLEGLRIKSERMDKNILITDIRPGLVNTPLTGRKESLFVAPVEKAALQICKGIENKARVVYVTRRYRIITYILRNLPFCIYSRL